MGRKAKMNYADYLRSDEWIRKRTIRIQTDGNSCAICGSSNHLQVHHMTYKNVPNEKNSDMITLCRNCHIKIENQKQTAYADSFYQVVNELVNQFIKDHEKEDLSEGGNKNYCDQKLIKAELYPYLRSKGFQDKLTGVLNVQSYFSAKRREIMLDLSDKGLSVAEIVKKTGFSIASVKNCLRNPERARDMYVKRWKDENSPFMNWDSELGRL
jgi:hypothetical protein